MHDLREEMSKETNAYTAIMALRRPSVLISCAYSRLFESDKWRNEIPYIKWPKDWEVKAVPPQTGAVVRYLVKKGDKEISIYLDCYDLLGCFGEPYWEAYPIDGDTFRCKMNNTASLLKALKREFRVYKK